MGPAKIGLSLQTLLAAPWLGAPLCGSDAKTASTSWRRTGSRFHRRCRVKSSLSLFQDHSGNLNFSNSDNFSIPQTSPPDLNPDPLVDPAHQGETDLRTWRYLLPSGEEQDRHKSRELSRSGSLSSLKVFVLVSVLVSSKE